MQVTFQVKTTVVKTVKYLQAKCGARYWEDARVNGVKDTDGTLIPFRVGDYWCPLIDLETGKVVGWPDGTTAEIHYKVCDDGEYALLDEDKNVVASKDGYVPSMMCPKSEGYGDYVIMEIRSDGTIENFDVDLRYFEGDE